MVKMLLKAHSRVNFKDLLGRTPLFFAVKFEYEEIVSLLLCFRADPNLQDNTGNSPTKIV